MKRKLLLCCAILVMGMMRVSAQDATSVWHIATDSRVYIPLEQVEFLLCADDNATFSIVKSDGEIVSGVEYVYFRNVPLAIDDVQDNEAMISIFPNPVVSNLQLKGIKESTIVQVLAVNGAIVIDTVVNPGNANINLDSLSAGVYMLKVNNAVVKFIKK